MKRKISAGLELVGQVQAGLRVPATRLEAIKSNLSNAVELRANRSNGKVWRPCIRRPQGVGLAEGFAPSPTPLGKR